MDDDQFIKLWKQISHLVRAIAEKYDRKWMRRKRSVDSFLLLLVTLRLASSRQGYGGTIASLWSSAREVIPRLRFLSPIAASTFCDARTKLDAEIFREINQASIQAYMAEKNDAHLWMGHRAFAIDASKINLPMELKVSGFKPPTVKSHYPQGLLSCLYEMSSKLPYDFQLQSKMSERICIADHLDLLAANDVVVYDRGYFSYDIARDHIQRGIHAVFRLKSKGNCRPLQMRIEHSSLDSELEVMPTSDRYTRKLKTRFERKNLEPIKLRLIKYRIKNKLYYLATTLLDKERYPVEALKSLYGNRWDVEEFYKVIKRVTEIENFHGRCEETVRQEVYAHMLLVTLGRLFSNEAEANIPRTLKVHRKNHYIKKKIEVIEALSKSISSTAYHA